MIAWVWSVWVARAVVSDIRAPRLTRGRQLCAVLCVLVTLAASPEAAALATSARERTLLTEMNRVRRAHGLRPFRVDPNLHRAARAHSRDMVQRVYFAHGRVVERLRRFRVRAPVVGENLAWGSGDEARARAIVHAWLTSPTHRRTLLRPGFRKVGIGAVDASFLGIGDATVVTADFAGR